jgi:hypothetical protein
MQEKPMLSQGHLLLASRRMSLGLFTRSLEEGPFETLILSGIPITPEPFGEGPIVSVPLSLRILFGSKYKFFKNIELFEIEAAGRGICQESFPEPPRRNRDVEEIAPAGRVVEPDCAHEDNPLPNRGPLPQPHATMGA